MTLSFDWILQKSEMIELMIFYTKTRIRTMKMIGSHSTWTTMIINFSWEEKVPVVLDYFRFECTMNIRCVACHVKSFAIGKYFSSKIHLRSNEVEDFLHRIIVEIFILAAIWSLVRHRWCIDTWRKINTRYSRSISETSENRGRISYPDDIYYQCREWITFIQSSKTQPNSRHSCKDLFSSILSLVFSFLTDSSRTSRSLA